MPNKEKTVYTVMGTDSIHAGHINIINESSKLGKVVVGVLTDDAISTFKRVPAIPYELRKKTIENIKGVDKVIPQYTLDYTDNLRKIKPDVVTNGDDWREGVQKETRDKVIQVLKEWDGELVEIPYTKGISSTLLIEDFRKNGITPEQRLNLLRRLINCKPIVRAIEAHGGLSALVAENTKVDGKEFDAIWESSLTDSSSKAKPDIELVDFTSRTHTINEIIDVTTKPIIVDGDTGGLAEHFVFMVKTLERLGVSAVIIEDKTFPKRNSLLEGADHVQESIPKFCKKIAAGKKASVTDDFMIFARIESLIAGKSVEDAIERARAYIKVGADGIMIHSKDKTPDKILEFCEQYKKFKHRVPLIAVPTTYNTITEKELIKAGVNVVIYANHLLRSSYKAMEDTAKMILKNERPYEAESNCYPLKDLFEIINANTPEG